MRRVSFRATAEGLCRKSCLVVVASKILSTLPSRGRRRAVGRVVVSIRRRSPGSFNEKVLRQILKCDSCRTQSSVAILITNI